MHIARLQPEPVHRRQMPDRVGGMAVQHQLRLRGGAGSEIQQQRIIRRRHPVGHEVGRCSQQAFVSDASRAASPTAMRGTSAANMESFAGVGRRCDHEAHPRPRHPLGQILGGQQRGRRHHHGAELHRRQHHFPERRDIAQHHQHTIAAPHAQRTQPVSHPVRPLRKLPETQHRSTRPDNAQRRRIGERACGQLGIEPVQRPVETLQRRPAETGISRRVIGAMRQQESSAPP